MSLSTERSTVQRLQKAIAELQVKSAQELRIESDATQKANRSMDAASKSKSSSTVSSKLREAERWQKHAADSAKKHAGYKKQIASKTQELHRAQERLSRLEKAEQDKSFKETEKRLAQLQATQRALNEANSISAINAVSVRSGQADQEHDVFISHASEDKDAFVRELAEALKERGVKVWYDEFTLSWGDPLRRRIDQGLANSRFGVVVLSKNFFAKEWPQNELEGLVAAETSGSGRILPIWHEITKDELLRIAPTMVGRLALTTATHSVAEICDKLQQLLKQTS